MGDRAFDLIQKLDVIGLGTAVIFLLVLGFIIVTVYKWQQKVTKEHDDRVLKEYQREKEYSDLINKTDELQQKLEGICGDISSMVKTIEENNNQTMARIDKIDKRLNDIKEESAESNSKMEASIEKISDNTEILTGSDMEQNRHTIVQAYNEYVVPGKPIDIYTLQAVRDAYKWYSAEHGNSHISDMMLDFERLKRNDLNATYVDYAAGKIKVLHGYLEDKVVDIDEKNLVQ